MLINFAIVALLILIGFALIFRIHLIRPIIGVCLIALCICYIFGFYPFSPNGFRISKHYVIEKREVKNTPVVK